jgi:hypothetical protein
VGWENSRENYLGVGTNSMKKNMVPMEGVEPTRPCGHQILSLARLPIPPHRHSKSAGGKSNQGWRGLARGFGNGISRGEAEEPVFIVQGLYGSDE